MANVKATALVDHGAATVTSILAQRHEHAVLRDDATSDEVALGELGYKQEFKRDFTLWETFAVSFSILGILPSIASTLPFGFGYAGTGGAIWGYLIAGLFIQCTAFGLAELCSSMPTAGGLYYASAVLAPDGYGPMAAWFVGYSNMLAFGVGPCSIDYALAYMLVTAGEIAYPNYSPQNWHIYLTLLALLILQGGLAMQSTRVIGWLNGLGTVANIVIFLIFIIWFPAGSINTPKTNGNQVWTEFTNGTEWPIGWATIMGFLMALFSMAGYDSSFHISEECSNANIAGPRAIVMTSQSGLWMGWAIVLVIAYTVQDLTTVVASTYGQPFASLCLQVLGPHAGLAMLSLTMVAQFFCGLGCMVSASRIVFSVARDGALPFSRQLAHVSRSFTTPVNAVWSVALFSALVGLLLFASPIAIGAVFTIAAIGQYTSFTVPVLLKLISEHKFRPGPWNLGRWSRPVNMVAVGWWLLILPALCFPATKGADLTLSTMNWTVLIYGGTMVLAMGFYALHGRHFFTGPKVNIEHTVQAAEHDRRLASGIAEVVKSG